jgi:hypothetical protein
MVTQCLSLCPELSHLSFPPPTAWVRSLLVAMAAVAQLAIALTCPSASESVTSPLHVVSSERSCSQAHGGKREEGVGLAPSCWESTLQGRSLGVGSEWDAQ